MTAAAKKSLAVTIILGVLFVLFTCLVKTVDVQPVGPDNSAVGFAALNGTFHEAAGLHPLWYTATEIFGYVAILVMAFFAVKGLLQLIQRKSLCKIDTDILLLGGLYILVVACYVLFEIAVINYRPVLDHGKLEASYPSSHTMLVLCVMGSTLYVLGKWQRFLPVGLRLTAVRCAKAGCAVLMILTAAGRLLAGVHWLTDIIGAVLLSAFLLSLFVCADNVFQPEK